MTSRPLRKLLDARFALPATALGLWLLASLLGRGTDRLSFAPTRHEGTWSAGHERIAPPAALRYRPARELPTDEPSRTRAAAIDPVGETPPAIRLVSDRPVSDQLPIGAPATPNAPPAASLGLPVELLTGPMPAEGLSAATLPPELADLPSACLSGLPGLGFPATPLHASSATGVPEAPPAPHVAALPPLGPVDTSALAAAVASTAGLAAPNSPIGTGGGSPDVAPVYRQRSDLASVEAYFDPHRRATEAGRVLSVPADDCGPDPHADVFRDTPFPSATECAKCHQQIYEEWAVSNHAYAGMSPMFHRFEDTLNRLSQGTLGYFCYRCHAPVATLMSLRRDQPIWNGPRVFREGVTCVVCHRVTEQYGKVNGERRIEPGSVTEPVTGTSDGSGVARVLQDADHFKVRDVPEGTGLAMHRRALRFEQLGRADFCLSCHQVAVYPNIKLEVVWDQYVASPAYREGITCQDCHMGKVPGLAEGYPVGAAAVIDGKPVLPERKHSNHVFYGPGYSIAHPGVFPHNVKADRWTFDQWLLFDWRAGWGTEAFETALERGEFRCDFPEVWANADDRYDAREILDENFRALDYKRETRRQVMENGSRIDGPFLPDDCLRAGERVVPRGRTLPLSYLVTNLNSGHNLPTASLGAQPQVWLNAVLVDPRGVRVWESGYLDGNGDLADLQSEDVLAGRLPHDDQLFNLQTKFLVTNLKGTDREVYLPVNLDIDQLPFLRPPGLPVSVLNHPPLIRMEAHSLPPLGSRDARYRIPGEALMVPGTYRLSIRMRSRAEPMYFMRFVGATPEMIRRMMEETLDCHVSTVVFRVE
jgi:hypothetical protein